MLYPNPANIVIDIQFSGVRSGMQSVCIYDREGQPVHEQTIELSGNSTVNIKSLDSGIYLLQINDHEGENTPSNGLPWCDKTQPHPESFAENFLN